MIPDARRTSRTFRTRLRRIYVRIADVHDGTHILYSLVYFFIGRTFLSPEIGKKH